MYQDLGEFDRRYFVGQVCSTSYVKARVSVSVTNKLTLSEVSVDSVVFASAQKLVDSSQLNITTFENDFMSQAGSSHLRPTRGIGFTSGDPNQNSDFEGPALVLSASRNYNIDDIMQMDHVELAQQA
jgi:hypothetical protein